MNLVAGGQTFATYETTEEYVPGYSHRVNIGTNLLEREYGCIPLAITVDVQRKDTVSQRKR